MPSRQKLSTRSPANRPGYMFPPPEVFIDLQVRHPGKGNQSCRWTHPVQQNRSSLVHLLFRRQTGTTVPWLRFFSSQAGFGRLDAPPRIFILPFPNSQLKWTQRNFSTVASFKPALARPLRKLYPLLRKNPTPEKATLQNPVNPLGPNLKTEENPDNIPFLRPQLPPRQLTNRKRQSKGQNIIRTLPAKKIHILSCNSRQDKPQFMRKHWWVNIVDLNWWIIIVLIVMLARRITAAAWRFCSNKNNALQLLSPSEK